MSGNAIWDLGFGIADRGSQIADCGSRILIRCKSEWVAIVHPKSPTHNPQFGIPNPSAQSEIKIRNPQSAI